MIEIERVVVPQKHGFCVPVKTALTVHGACAGLLRVTYIASGLFPSMDIKPYLADYLSLATFAWRRPVNGNTTSCLNFPVSL